MSATPKVGVPPADGDVTVGPVLNGVMWLFATLATCALIFRSYVRVGILRHVGWDDALLGTSLVLLYIQCAFVSVAVHHGSGRHQYYIIVNDPNNIANVVNWQKYSIPIALIGGSLPKLAVTYMLIKILSLSKLSIAWLWSINVLLLGLAIATSVTSFVAGLPTTADSNLTIGVCWNTVLERVVSGTAISQGAFSAFVDVSLALFPVTTIWHLQLARRKKVAICFLMGLGCFAGVASIIRIVSLNRLKTHCDFTWEAWRVVMWIGIETSVVIICACIPSLRPLFHRKVRSASSPKPPVRTGFFSWHRKRRTHTSNSFGLEPRLSKMLQSTRTRTEVGFSGDEAESQVSFGREINVMTAITVEREECPSTRNVSAESSEGEQAGNS
ncbi:hypothetical protein BDV96DRAFT_690917 [Lophiotrema nucula]|uniref:Rhodopsin domain-containing protein n=1 Tax=Lophiotrema nucula TaxID=690887 RepID=A0A6A5YTS8_9PLEO|nr:hypothetical protein BDV96DRAFT_690917 [Lophiotrema nucula]